MAVVIDVQPTIWAYTTIITFTSTITATPGETLYIEYPPATTTPALSYTQMYPMGNGSKFYPTPLPILVLTEWENILVDSTGSVIETQFLIQSPPPISPTLPAGYDPGTQIVLINPGNGWSAWTRGERAGVLVALSVLMIVIVGSLGFLALVLKKRRGYRKTYEEGYRIRNEKKHTGTGSVRSKRSGRSLQVFDEAQH